jgi:hypothetical protein
VGSPFGFCGFCELRTNSSSVRGCRGPLGKSEGSEQTRGLGHRSPAQTRPSGRARLQACPERSRRVPISPLSLSFRAVRSRVCAARTCEESAVLDPSGKLIAVRSCHCKPRPLLSSIRQTVHHLHYYEGPCTTHYIDVQSFKWASKKARMKDSSRLCACAVRSYCSLLLASRKGLSVKLW